ncbi:desmocollin-2-like [Myripristis murdjan]|uniref:desmocollin-2-like n=1 Tax=Myripristis murdjan TaxID=586833 RepID=UPI00117603F9|nr:desmocollin-2-like [Myripristis murdjan]
MAQSFVFYIITITLMLSYGKACFPPNSIHIVVPQTIPAGHVISTGNVDCGPKFVLTTSDPSFTVGSNRTIIALSKITLTSTGRTFSLWAEDSSGQKTEMVVRLVAQTVPNNGFLRRSKRRWGIPPFDIPENTVKRNLGPVRSDTVDENSMYYTVSGPGVTEPPVGVFSIERYSGELLMLKPVDREEYPIIKFIARVYDRNTNKETDRPLNIIVNITDLNDNEPTFTGPLQFSVLEQTKAVVGKVSATDRDQEGTPHTKIKYSLLTGTDLFAIEPETGVISTVTETLDREVKDTHLVTVQIADMSGGEGALSNTATATITLRDINDNPPTFTKTNYDVNVEENQSDQLILRIPVEDKDLENTPNWNSQFLITKGNENGYFRMERDPKTNEGLLYTSKPLDYEKMKNIKLEVTARNQAELEGAKASWVSIPVDVTVTNVDEGPEFTAPTIRFVVREDTEKDKVIGSYTAADPETKSSAGIKYYKVTDPTSWIDVDMNSGELKVVDTIDRESQLLQDGIYNITMKAVDASLKTGTGTVIIQVEDVNDHVPEVPDKELVLCDKDEELGSVLVVAEDKDQPPFSAPFRFAMGADHDGNWAIEALNDTAATLKQTKELPTGIYTVPVEVNDLQGSGKTQMVTVRICQCRNGACPDVKSSVSLGALALLAMLLPLALLLLLCLLLCFFCVTKNNKWEELGESSGVLLKSNIEAPGDQVDSNLIIVPNTGIEQPGNSSVKGSALNADWQGNKSSSTIGGFAMQESGVFKSSGVMVTGEQNEFSSGQYGNQFGTGQFGTGQFGTGQFGTGQFGGSSFAVDKRHLFYDSALHHTWQTNGRYLQQKLSYLGTEEGGRYADDILHSYGFEGEGSAAGSVGCCSDQGNQDNLDFLNTLDPKFKTLADICSKR